VRISSSALAERVEIHSQFDAISAEWDALAARLQAVPWDRPGWISAWHASFGRGEPRVLALRRGDSLAGVLPLEAVRGALRSPTNYHTPSFAGVFADDGAAFRLAEVALAETRRHLRFSLLDSASPLVRAIGELTAQPGAVMHSRVMDRAPYLALPESPERFEAALTAKRRSGLRRLRRRLTELGEVSFEVCTGEERLDERLSEGFAMERSGWKGEHGTAITSQAATRNFYRAIAGWLAQRGWLRLAFLRLSGRTIAFDLAVEIDGVHYLVKTGYDEGLRPLAPGMVLRHEMILRCIRGGCRSYELLGSDMPWKRVWTQTLHDRLQLHAFPATVSGRADWLIVAGVFPVARRVRSRARVARAAAARLL
jgi:CelD/BcsL family acetyltransferase involved in cellulose biosynthesis